MVLVYEFTKVRIIFVRIRNHELVLGLGVCARAMYELKRMHRPGIAAADLRLTQKHRWSQQRVQRY